VVDAAAKSSGLDIVEIKSYLPAGLTIWIDPGEVSCRLTENGPVQVIYRGAGGGGGGGVMVLDGGVRRGVDGDEVERETGVPRGLPSPSPAPGWSSPAPTTRASTCFTAATFAQTKFGSTKMKSQGPQRPSRLSPVEPPLPLSSAGFAGGGARLSPSSAPACWSAGLSPTGANRPSPLQPSATFAMMPPADARLAGLQDWIVLQQRHHQQQMHYLTALKQQQQQQQQGVARLASPHHYGHHLQLSQQLQQPVPPLPPSAHGLVASPEPGVLMRDAGVAAGVKNDGAHLSAADCVDWGLDASAVPGFAAGLQQLLLAN